MITLLTGGARSGKSRHALELAAGNRRKAFVATAEPIDDEMRQRIDVHRHERDPSFLTVEEPLDVASAIIDLPPAIDIAVIDCLTVWLGNLLHAASIEGGGSQESDKSEKSDKSDARQDLPSLATMPQIQSFLQLLDQPPAVDLIVVTNEVGMGIVPASPLGREFRDLAGGLNQAVAARADQVVLMVSGIPVTVRP